MYKRGETTFEKDIRPRRNEFVFDRPPRYTGEEENLENSEGDVIICRTNKDIHHVRGRGVSRADTGYIHKA